MIDTIQVSTTLPRPPDFFDVVDRGWKTLLDRQTGEIKSFCLNSGVGAGKPRLTLSTCPIGLWNLRAEASPGSWLFGSNLHLVNEAEKDYFLDCISEYTEVNSGITFNAHTARVTRVDFTRDFQVGENNVLPIVAQFSHLQLPKYKRLNFNGTTIKFRNAGKALSKQFQIYSKYEERVNKRAILEEQERAKGLLRLEISVRNSGVHSMVKSLKLKSNHALDVLTKAVSNQVIEKAMKFLKFDKLLKVQTSDPTILFKKFNFTKASKLASFLWLKEKLGSDYSRFEEFGISKRTCQRYWEICKDVGVLSLE
jgi:hypothetical protein